MEKTEEEQMYDETLLYLICKCKYPESASKQYKGVIRKHSKHYTTRRATSHHLPSLQLPCKRTLLLRLTLTGSALLCRDNWRKGHSVMELSGMPRKRQESTVELTDKFPSVYIKPDLLNDLLLKLA